MTAGLRLRKQNLGCVRVVMCHSDREPVHTRARRSVMNDGGRPRLSIHIVRRERERERDRERGGERDLVETRRTKTITPVIQFEVSRSLRTSTVCHFGFFFLQPSSSVVGFF